METLKSKINAIHTLIQTAFVTQKPTLQNHQNLSQDTLYTSSHNIEAIKLKTYASFTSYKHKCVKEYKEDTSPNGSLPYLYTADGKALVGNEIIDRIKQQTGYDLRLACQDSDAFISLTESKLGVAYIYSLWCTPKYYTSIILPLYESLYPWLLGKLIAKRERDKHIDLLLTRKSFLIADEIYSEADQALNALSIRLDTSPYFGGDQPSYLDAVVFAHVHVILSTFSDTEGLKGMVVKYENLVVYARRIWNTWFVQK